MRIIKLPVCLRDDFQPQEFEVVVESSDRVGADILINCSGNAVNQGNIFVQVWTKKLIQSPIKKFRRYRQDFGVADHILVENSGGLFTLALADDGQGFF